MKLTDIISDTDRLLTGEDIPEQYRTDQYIENIPAVNSIALPKTTEEVQELVKYANEKHLKIIARGAGTGVAGSQIPVHGNELIIDVSLMNRIKDLDEKTMTLTVEPGVILSDVQAYAQKHDYYYPPDPASKHSSIGGNVMMNSGGLRAIKYGTTRNYVRQIEVVLPTGERVTLGSLNLKDSSGYDLKDLLIGSEGTLGIITQIKLRLLPLPAHKKSVLLAFDSIDKGTDGVLKILANGVEPAALELFEKSTIQYSEAFTGTQLQSKKGNAYILMTFDDDSMDSINSSISVAQDILGDQAEEIVPLNADEEKIAWDLRDKILIALMEFTEFEMLDEVVPIHRFAEMIAYTKELEAKHGLRVVNFGHAGDGNVHTILMKEDLDKQTWLKRRKALLDDLYEKVDELGGLPAAEHGIGTIKKPYLLKTKDKSEIDMMRKIKQAIDPDNRLNPDKIF